MASAIDVPAEGQVPADRFAFLRVRGDMPDALRITLGVACILAFWNHAPLKDLSDRSMLETDTGGSLSTQVIFLGLGLSMAMALLRLGVDKLRPLLTWPLVILAGWLVLTMVTSVEPLLSIRRVTLFAIGVLLTAGIPVVMRSVRQFALTLAICSFVILISSYLAVAFLPHLAIHNEFDLLNEPEHTGLWRGIFQQKNEAGGAMVLIILSGLFVSSALNRLAGLTIVVLAAVFIAFTQSKTSIFLLPLVILIPSLCRVFRGATMRAALFLGPTVFFALFSLGSVFFPPIRDGLSDVLPDVSFTGRTEVWEFAADHILERPIVGWGLGAFWGTEQTRFSGNGLNLNDGSDWVTKALHAHNSYLDTALIMGLPGVVLTLIAFFIAPLRDLQRIAPDRQIEPIDLYFMRLWLLAAVGGSLETVLYNANLAICCMFMLAVFGLRMHAAYRLAPE